MMGIHQPQPELFSYQVNLEKRIRAEHPLRRVLQRGISASCGRRWRSLYGYNGHESVDPVILLKLMFLLFWDNVASERELMAIIPERYREIYFPRNLKGMGMCQKVTPQDMVQRLNDLEILKELKE